MAAGLYDITTETLGKGHFAVVKLAKHCLTGESVAIKIIDKAKLNKDGLQQLGSEIRLWSRLSEHEHPNVVKLYQCIDTRTKLYLVMEYCGRDVCDLYDYIQKRYHGNGLIEPEAKHIFRQISGAISYCHSSRIVHRDLKPENILIITQPIEQINVRVKYPLVKLIDFGFSNQWADGEMLRTSCGSLAYSAPEILLGDHYDGPKVDIWGLGCILYILLYGSNPFMQINDSETLCRILDCTFSTPPRPSISNSAIELIKALLKREPNDRLSIQEVIANSWLDDSDEFCFETIDSTPKSQFVQKTVKKSVHDRVIDQMLSQGIGSSRENIEKALEESRLEENNCSGLKSSPTPDDSAVNGERTQSSLNHDHYIKATYHLLKDKRMRELHGLNQNNSLVNQNVSGHLHKRLLPLKPRKHLIQQISRNTQPFQEEDGEEDNPISFSANCQNIQQLELPNDDGTGFILPLARKCSIVSEEGSCVAEGTGSDISNYEGPNPREEIIEKSTTHAIVNIVVTDCSEADKSDDRYESNESLRIDSGPNCDDIVSPEKQSTKTTPNKNGNLLNKNTSNIATNSTLHLVSSSPELLRNNDNEDMDDNDYDNYISQPSRNRPTTMILCNERKHDKEVDHMISHFGTNVSTNNSSVNTNSPSMRVITQSKSCNNILFNENDSSISDPKSSELTNANSVCMRKHKSDRTDCCTIC